MGCHCLLRQKGYFIFKIGSNLGDLCSNKDAPIDALQRCLFTPPLRVGGSAASGCRHVAGTQAYPAVLEPPTPPATATEEGAAQEGEGDAGPAPGTAGQAPLRGQAVGVLRSREVEKAPATHTAMRGQAGEGAAARRGRSRLGAEPGPGWVGRQLGSLGPGRWGTAPAVSD